MASQSQHQWQRMKKIDRQKFDIDQDGPFAMDSGNKIVFCTYGGGVAVYDEKKDSMALMAPYPKDQQPGKHHTYCHHPASNQVFIFRDKDIFICNLSNKQWCKERSEIDTSNHCSCLCMKGQIHIFGHDKHHLIYNMEERKMYVSGVRFEKRLISLRSVAPSHSDTVFVVGGWSV